MVRTQVQLTDEQARLLKRLAASEGVSMATLIRHSIDQYVQQRASDDADTEKQRALDVVGKYASQSGDGSQEHDRYLAELCAGLGH